jgi:hypothetical protein
MRLVPKTEQDFGDTIYVEGSGLVLREIDDRRLHRRDQFFLFTFYSESIRGTYGKCSTRSFYLRSGDEIFA